MFPAIKPWPMTIEDSRGCWENVACCLGNMYRIVRQGIELFHFWMKIVEYLFKEISTPRHEGIAKALKICTITHFFCENVGGVALSCNMCDCDGAVFNPLSY
jgi:hypothetical protein